MERTRFVFVFVRSRVDEHVGRGWDETIDAKLAAWAGPTRGGESQGPALARCPGPAE